MRNGHESDKVAAMSSGYAKALDGLSKAGWSVERLARRRALPAAIVKRYPGIPADYRKLIELFGNIVSSDERAWFVTSSVFSTSDDTAFAWNEWEQQSLEAAAGYDDLAASIRDFWDRHLPVLMSVKSGYAYFALDLDTLEIVQGEEPEYEEAEVVASSLDELLAMLIRKDPELELWV